MRDSAPHGDGATGSIKVDHSQVRDINTGFIEKHTHLTLNVFIEHIDRLAVLLCQADGSIRSTPTGSLEAVAGEEVLPLPANLLDGLQLLPRALDADADLRCRAYAAWVVTYRPMAPPQCVAAHEHYIPLAGRISLLDLHFSGRHWRGEGPQRQLERVPLRDVTEAVNQYPAFVLLGQPGSGKSTVLHRLALEAARALLTGQSRLLPLWLTLAEYHSEKTTPLEFVSRRWAEQAPDDFLTMVRAGRVLLLADGLNEMLRLDTEGERRRRANDWQRFIETHFADSRNASRAVIASRDQADYDQPLGLPRVEIDPLSDEQIIRFLSAYLGGETEAEGALAAIRRLGLIEQVRNPYSLSVLAALYDPQQGDLPPNRGRLFAEYAHSLVLAEEHVGHPHWIQPEAQLAALAELGFALQDQSEGMVLPAGRLQALIPKEVSLQGRTMPVSTPPGDVFDLACRAGLLVRDPSAAGPDAYKFSHQLLQEQFAARHILARWQVGDDLAHLWRTPRTPRQMPPAEVGELDPLPPPPPTGWEQSAILAAGLADRPDAFVRAVRAGNPALAGRCLSEGAAPVDAETRTAVQEALLADLSDPALHRRTRLQAGRVLGTVGDPRLTPQVVDGVEVIWPDWVYVSGGRATIGSRPWPWDRQAFPDERPRCTVDITPFYLGRTPVTNAEYACFWRAGGYDVEHYWTPAGWQWRQGTQQDSGPIEEWLAVRRYLIGKPHELERLVKDEGISQLTAKGWQVVCDWSEDEARRWLEERFLKEPHTKPRFWDDPAYNLPNQPVVGVTWYEAMAYCAWLTERLQGAGAEGRLPLLAGVDRAVRLPSEAEWEWAAGGPRHTTYPWGRPFDPDKANTLGGRVLGPSPVGAYPAGAAACGALDVTGNVWEWTLSLFKGYRCRPEDGREDPLAESRRTLRGGSWDSNRRLARVSRRTGDPPALFNFDLGFRVVVVPV